MDRFENTRVFAAVVEAGKLYRRRRAARHVARRGQQACLAARGAARRPPAQPHDAAGQRHRSRAGFYEQCRRILAELEEAERAAGELHNEPRGELRIIAPTNFGLAEIGTGDHRPRRSPIRAAHQSDLERPRHRPDRSGLRHRHQRRAAARHVVEPDRAQAQYRRAAFFARRRIIWRGAARRSGRKTSRSMPA